MSDFLMPSLGADMEEGTVIRWLVGPGDRVRRGQIIVEIETEKADMEVEVFEEGSISELLVPEGETVAVGTPLARIAAVGSQAAPAPVPAAKATTVGAIEAAAPIPGKALAPTRPKERTPAAEQHVTPLARKVAEQLGVNLARVRGTGAHGGIVRADVERAAENLTRDRSAASPERALRISPYARRLAKERGTDLASVSGTGPGGAVVARDILARADGTPPAAVRRAEERPDAERDLRRRAARQRTIGALMARSKREIPHYYLQQTIDISGALAWLQRENAARPIADRVLLPALLLRAVAAAVADVPEMNGTYEDDEFREADAVNLGVAIALRDGGLVTPAILSSERLSLVETMRALRDVVQRSREGKLRASEMASGTITVTNLGDTGVESVQGVIYPPQVALVGFGRPTERPWAENGMLAVRTVITMTLAGDHRVSNGHRGGMFLNAIARRIQKPETL
ncbi:MAG: 2-oxo acid dehydrogenase subunit E2 [Dehalococcoidia bacterium]